VIGEFVKDDSKIMKNCAFSIIIPVLHEARHINPLLEHLQQLDENCDIIVVDGCPKRETIDNIKNKDIKILISEAGRGRQMNTGAASASGEILIFLHADTRIPTNALNKINRVLKQEQYIGGAFDLGIRSDKLILKVIAKCASLRSRLTRIPYGDQAIFIRKDYFNKIGGYKEIPLMEDVELMQRIKKRGDKIYIFSDRVFTSPRRWEKEGIICCTLRNWIIIILHLIGISPDKLARYYGRN
jgi:rSAM/selenodomain-associated transferase 2